MLDAACGSSCRDLLKRGLLEFDSYATQLGSTIGGAATVRKGT